MSDRPRVELLAPAGGPPALQAALSAGADAVYLGLDRWSARAFADNFSIVDLSAAIDRAHLYGARVHLALNVLLKDEELEAALDALKPPYEAGLDALIVADLGFVRLVRERYPDLELHASTQLNTHSSAQLERLARLGFSRAILARELSLAESAALDDHGLELEAFVHGALCYGYSGDCLLASMIGGRSGNRGRCSQSCRMKYELTRADVAGAAAEASLRRVLSTADLAAIDSLPALIAAGVRSFKIEGRMKDAGYVAVATSVYREALDAALADPGGYQARPEWRARLEQSFSRGFTTAHLDGRHAEVRSGGRGGHRGAQVGRVASVNDATGAVTVRLVQPLASGDVVQIYTPSGATEPQRVHLDERATGSAAGDRVVLRVRERVAVKDRVFRLSSAEADRSAAAAVAGRSLARPVALTASLSGVKGERPLLVVAADGEEASLEGQQALEPARTAALTTDKARRAIGALGGTPYELTGFECDLPEGSFLPVAALRELRRRALAELDERRLRRARRTAPAAAAGRPHLKRAVSPPHSGRLCLVLRLRPNEPPFAWDHIDAVCLDLQVGDDPAVLAAAAARIREAGKELRCRTPEVLFDQDGRWWQAVAALNWDVIQARHAVALSGAGWVQGPERASSRSETRPAVLLEYPLQGLNVAAASTLDAQGVVCSPEVSLEEIAVHSAALRAAHAGARLEIIAFGRESVLSTRDRLGQAEGLVGDLGPGETAELELVDAKAYRFPAIVTAGGTRIGNARVTNLCAHLEELGRAGIGAIHVVAADMTAAEREAFCARGPGGLAAAVDRERFTTGHLFRGVD